MRKGRVWGEFVCDVVAVGWRDDEPRQCRQDQRKSLFAVASGTQEKVKEGCGTNNVVSERMNLLFGQSNERQKSMHSKK